ncbi:MAG: hypothetical protein M5U31_16400 [Acidimicrobiia bacterium]|nr:hypothetical protein [Acidimicrobiia bacterium]
MVVRASRRAQRRAQRPPPLAILGVDNAAVIIDRQPHVFYWDVSHGDLRHAWFG